MAPTILDLLVTASTEDLQENHNRIQEAINKAACNSTIDKVVRFPAGVYRIYGKLDIPFCQGISLVGDGGLGGTTIVQCKDDEPIIEFAKKDTWGWTIGNLCFKWKTRQTCDHDHSVAIHFQYTGCDGGGYYHGVIERCYFEGAYRGVSLSPWEKKFVVEPEHDGEVVKSLDKLFPVPEKVTRVEGVCKEDLEELAAQFCRLNDVPLAFPVAVTLNRSQRNWVIHDDGKRVFRVWKEKVGLNVYRLAMLPVWNTHIDHCVFSGCRGSAIWLNGNFGMPNNAISNTLIENYLTLRFHMEPKWIGELDAKDSVPSARLREQFNERLKEKEYDEVLTCQARKKIVKEGSEWTIEDDGRKYLIQRDEKEPRLNVYYDPKNEEPQLSISAQSGMSLTNLDMEGSSTTVIRSYSSTISINGLHLEWIRGQEPGGHILNFGDLNYVIHGLSWGITKFDPPGPLYLILGGGGANIVVTGVNVQFAPGCPTHPIYLFAGQGEDQYGRKNSFRLVGKYKRYPEKNLELCPDDVVELVTVDPIKVRRKLIFPDIKAGATREQEESTYLFNVDPKCVVELVNGPVSQTLRICFQHKGTALCAESRVEVDPSGNRWTIVDGTEKYVILRENQTLNVYQLAQVVIGARPGDIVSLGPPSNLQAGLIAFGLVTAPDTVGVRILNTTLKSITPVPGIWTTTTGGGRQFE